MSFARPSPAAFKATFLAFASVDDAAVQSALDGAPVDDSWSEGDFATAIMLYAAWWLTDGGLGNTPQAKRAAAGLTGLQRMKTGSLEIWHDTTATKTAGIYGTNTFGVRFYTLLRRNRGGPRITPVVDNGINPLATDCS